MRIQYNSPVILTFSIVVVLIHVFSEFTSIDVSKHFFTIYDPMSIKDPIAYFRLFSHILGHSSWSHLTGNLTLVLLLGPILEERYGSRTVLIMILATALITGFVHIAVPLFDNMGLRGASGIVFMLIVLSSFVNVKRGTIPLTFILIATLYLGKEVVNVLQNDNISQMAHIVGGALGSFFGFALQDDSPPSTT
ncbi:rhomboid family intramembrane serine protease [Candidatus Poribacteria bacterium]|nr:rhomboid family intramembrane serine protease [Candidatus Poribacteria bacterium]